MVSIIQSIRGEEQWEKECGMNANSGLILLSIMRTDRDFTVVFVLSGHGLAAVIAALWSINKKCEGINKQHRFSVLPTAALAGRTVDRSNEYYREDFGRTLGDLVLTGVRVGTTCALHASRRSGNKSAHRHKQQ